MELVRQYPGQEKEVWEHYRKNPQALAEVRAPLFEEKVVDHIIAQATVSDRKVSREELFKVEAEEGKPLAMAASEPDATEPPAPASEGAEPAPQA